MDEKQARASNNMMAWIVKHIQWGFVYIANFSDGKDVVLEYCNEPLSDLIKLKDVHDFSAFFYEKLKTGLKLSDEQISDFKSRDLNAQFLKEPDSCVVTMNLDGAEKHYICDRYPIPGVNKKIIGVMTTILDDFEVEERIHKRVDAIKKTNVRHPLSVKIPGHHRPRILVIDEKPLNRKAITKELTSLACDVDCPTSEQEALSMFEPGKYDLVMTESRLEQWKTSGFYLVKQFRLREKGTEYYVNAILLTIYDTELMINDCKDPEVDINGIAKQPVKKEQLNQILGYYVRNEDIKPDYVTVL